MKIRKFFEDFVGAFLHFIFIGLSIFVHLVYHIISTLSLFVKNVIIPNLTELFADFSLFMYIVMQGVYSMLSSCSLWLSKGFLNMSRYFHNKSENIVSKTWDVY